MMHVELDWRELTNPPAPITTREPAITAPQALTPPRLRVVDAEATHVLPHVASADVWLSRDVVDRRASTSVAAARAAGVPNSMRLWRESHQDALLALAREAASVPVTARCAAITWVQVGDDYHVTASFTTAPLH